MENTRKSEVKESIKEYKYEILLGLLIMGTIFYSLYKKYFNNSIITKQSSIPNNIHFVFGLKQQNEEFLFSYFLAIYSAWTLNKPDKIYFYYHYEPYGEWFDKIKEIPNIVFEKVDIPTHIGKKSLFKIAHKADIVRMEKLIERGGIYMDMDTISVRSYTHLLDNDVVLGKEGDYGICNAIMMTKPNSEFFKIWFQNYENEFKSDGWREASIELPRKIANQYPKLLTLQEEDVFFLPSYYETDKIFEKDYDIPDNLITLHLWESYSMKYMKDINPDWIQKNKHTMYSKIVSKIIGFQY